MVTIMQKKDYSKCCWNRWSRMAWGWLVLCPDTL